MGVGEVDKKFSGSISEIYERLMVPLIFEPYAADLAARVAALSPKTVLELAAGTGVVTRALAQSLPPATQIIATDLNPPMLDIAIGRGTSRPVEWRQADAMALPFPDQSADVVVCQFGAMFFPDRGHAFAQTRRVLKPGGTFLFNVWDRIEDNVFTDVVTQALAGLFPQDPPRFMARTPHGYHDAATIRADLAKGGFTAAVAVETLTFQSHADSALAAAQAICQGTPLRSEIEGRDPAGLARATQVAAEALAKRFGGGRIAGKIQALVVTVRR